MKLRIIVELAKDKSQGENGNKQNREKNKETCDLCTPLIQSNLQSDVAWFENQS